MTHQGDRLHPVINLHDFDILELSFRRESFDSIDGTLDLTVSNGKQVRRLRFLGVENLSIKDGFPHERGIAILDISKRGLDCLRVLVTDVDGYGGEVQFWARDVVDLDEVGTAEPGAADDSGM